ncbi:MAG: hypothetical protein ACI9OO_000079 [Bacteroidia bacterium]|jgi:hypothetical protein
MQAVLDLIRRQCRGGTVELVAPDFRRWRLGSGQPVAAVRIRDLSVICA